MREILFRGKRTDNGEWVEGGYYTNGKKHFIVSKRRYKPDTRDWDTAEFYDNNPVYRPEFIEVDPFTVRQFTGLYDKNGERIWEGDILSDDNGFRGFVEAEKWGCDCDWQAYGFVIKSDYINTRNYYFCSVIGNIHDNKELLEVNNEK